MSRPPQGSPSRQEAARRRLAELRGAGGPGVVDRAGTRIGTSSRFPVLRSGPRLERLWRYDAGEIGAAVRAGVYEALEHVVLDRAEADAMAALERADLRNAREPERPSFGSWSRARTTPARDRRVVCDAARPGPAGVVDDALVEGDPHRILEAVVLSGRLVGASRGVVCVHDEPDGPARELGAALAEARGLGLVGPDVLGSGFGFEIQIRRLPRVAILATDSALVRAIDGERPMPAASGPSSAWIAGVESLLQAAAVVAGRPEESDRCVSLLGGAVRRAGLVDVPRSIGLGELIETAGGGPCRGRFLGARVGDSTAAYLSPDRASTTFSDLLDRGIDPSAVLVLDDDCCVLDVLAHDLAGLADESCGKCPSCRVGLAVLSRRIGRVARGAAGDGEPAATAAWAAHVRDTALCRLGRRAARSVSTVLEGFPETVDDHLHGDRCRCRNERRSRDGCYPNATPEVSPE